jgi:Phytanoyl-CoA dioxygenase (PhyH)
MMTTTRPVMLSQGIELSLDSDKFAELRDSSDAINDPIELNARMDSEGCLLIRGLLPRDEVLEARQEVIRRLANLGFLAPGSRAEDAIGISAKHAADLQDRRMIRSERYDVSTDFMADDLAKGNEPLHRVLYGPAMMSFFERLLGEPARHFDFTWFRSIFPHSHGTAAHTDVIFMGRAEREQLYTAWTPIGDIDYEQGGLIILEGSHLHPGLRDGYSAGDVDALCGNKPDQLDWWERGRKSDGQDVMIAKSASAVRDMIGGRWLTAEFTAGDVLIFSVFTVHGSLDNQSDRIRLSSDSRYQPASKPADERWIGANPAGHGPRGKRNLIC